MFTFGSLKATEATELYPFGTIASHNDMLLADLQFYLRSFVIRMYYCTFHASDKIILYHLVQT